MAVWPRFDCLAPVKGEATFHCRSAVRAPHPTPHRLPASESEALLWPHDGTGHRGTPGPAPAPRGCVAGAVPALLCAVASSSVPGSKAFAVLSRGIVGSTGSWEALLRGGQRPHRVVFDCASCEGLPRSPPAPQPWAHPASWPLCKDPHALVAEMQ